MFLFDSQQIKLLLVLHCFCFKTFHQPNTSHSLNTSCKTQDTVQYSKKLAKLFAIIFRIIKPQLFILFNYACKKIKSCQFLQSYFPKKIFFRLVKKLLAKINPHGLIWAFFYIYLTPHYKVRISIKIYRKEHQQQSSMPVFRYFSFGILQQNFFTVYI